MRNARGWLRYPASSAFYCLQQRRILRCYRCMLFNLRLEMEAYLRYEKTFERIVGGCPAEDCEDGMEYNEEWEDDEYDLDEV